MQKEQKCYSLDGEIYRFDSLQDAIDSMLEPSVGEVIYEGDASYINGSDLFCFNNFIDDLNCRLYDEVGEAADDGLDFTEKDAEELQLLIENWINEKTDVGRYYKVRNEKQRALTEEDFKEKK